MELSLKRGGEWMPVINRKSGRLELGGPVSKNELLKITEEKEDRVGDIPTF
jgi:hypothetical protein